MRQDSAKVDVFSPAVPQGSSKPISQGAHQTRGQTFWKLEYAHAQGLEVIKAYLAYFHGLMMTFMLVLYVTSMCLGSWHITTGYVHPWRGAGHAVTRVDSDQSMAALVVTWPAERRLGGV
ncbi:hypothetical protein O3P69_002585 [Scylla paramamosain]|uniref:Uncharacterized protein n=1 Tax=Scylla paramamosain TaxID=85552 RepID=A0AAW0UML6_SCYPA